MAAAFAFGAIVFLLGCAGSAMAQSFSVNLSMDENGNGQITNSAGFSAPLSHANQTDTGPGGQANVLTYDLLSPPGLTAGDILIDDFGTNIVSDIIRFNPSGSIPGNGSGVLVFYSLDALGSLADISNGPSANYTNLLTLSEDANGQLLYTPTAGQPGFVAGAGGPVTFQIISDIPAAPAVPEPASMVLLGGGLACLRLLRRKLR